jgi:hypothetical protein
MSPRTPSRLLGNGIAAPVKDAQARSLRRRDPWGDVGFELQRLLRPHCRNYHFGELVEGGLPVGIYILTPDAPLAPWLKKDITDLVLETGFPLRTKVSFFSHADNAEPHNAKSQSK